MRSIATRLPIQPRRFQRGGEGGGRVRVVGIAFDVRQKRLEPRVHRFEAAQNMKRLAGLRNAQALEGVITGRLLAGEIKDVFRARGQEQVEALAAICLAQRSRGGRYSAFSEKPFPRLAAPLHGLPHCDMSLLPSRSSSDCDGSARLVRLDAWYAGRCRMAARIATVTRSISCADERQRLQRRTDNPAAPAAHAHGGLHRLRLAVRRASSRYANQLLCSRVAVRASPASMRGSFPGSPREVRSCSSRTARRTRPSSARETQDRTRRTI